ncbi:tetratricopeptide (TPR) repeat protein [Methylohalomonas lacus]|uniref:Tetratricopeptide (TPR) repeat protein n=1 Tax=Methylohalomonas lacus TaxID=398773 RepID=A0AAE3HNE2_9GAMM|nr:SEC-C metal-binding domain-containing protein [Methylohalomonas lacus]MCS3904516.1 tetratricopeptide (TPR) repeat protein [Methylohalomonas lacus]
MQEPEDPKTPIDFEAFLSDAAAQIRQHEDPQQFLDWCRKFLPRYLLTFDSDFPEPGSPEWPAFALYIGRGIWNAMPLPGNDYRPRPLPAPGRNDPCPCGSGRKYKRCCIRLDAGDMQLDSRTLWPYLARQFKQNELGALAGSGAIPVASLVDIAQQFLDQLQTKKCIAVLEPLFSSPIRKPDALHDEALTLLCEGYDDLGYHNKKMALLKWVTETHPASVLRAGAWQRLATIRLDEGDSEAAWAAFEQAGRDEPDALSLGLLEIQMLYAENRIEECRQRADYWLQRLKQLEFDPEEMPARFFAVASHDPGAAMANIGLGRSDGAGTWLQDWLSQHADRPIPAYAVTEEPVLELAGEKAGTATDLLEHLRAMGIPEEQVPEDLLDDLDSDKQAPQEDENTEDDPAIDEESLFLQGPDLSEVTAQWRAVFPLGKPFSVHEVPFDESGEVWMPDIELSWMKVLDEHPEALDSLDIIDDLATALYLHPDYGARWLDDALLLPVLERARAIIEQAFAQISTPRLLWLYSENRSALRNLVRLYAAYDRLGWGDEALALAEWILALNPHDSHGLRYLIINERLRRGDDTAALSLAEQYSDDIQPDPLYGRALALYRLGRLYEADAALQVATQRVPKVVDYLCRKRIREPELSSFGIQVGGDDQAWYYRLEMRETWAQTAGALAWLKKHQTDH